MSIGVNLPAETGVSVPAASHSRNHRPIRKRVGEAWYYAIVIALTALFIAPLMWLFATSLKTPAGIAAHPVQWIPNPMDWSNYADALTQVPFFEYTWHSFIIGMLSGGLGTLMSAYVGFGFARLRGAGKNALFIILLATMMLPGILTLIPMYVIFAKLGLVNTYWPWFFWGLSGTPYLIFMFRQFFTGIPIALEDAAILDGCGYLRIFFQIFLPQAKPMLATSFILSFTWAWGDYVTQALLLSSDKWTLAVALVSGFTNQQGLVVQNMLAAGAIMYVIPVLAIFFVSQRNYQATAATTGVK